MRTRFVILALAGTCTLAVYVTASSASETSVDNNRAHIALGTRELDEHQQVSHALSRLTFGARPGDVERVQAMGVDRWIERQLHPERIDDAATDQFLSRYETLALSSAELYRQFPPAALLRNIARRDCTRRWSRPNWRRASQAPTAPR